MKKILIILAIIFAAAVLSLSCYLNRIKKAEYGENSNPQNNILSEETPATSSQSLNAQPEEESASSGSSIISEQPLLKSESGPLTISILQIMYFPLSSSSPALLDPQETDSDFTLVRARQIVNEISSGTIEGLEKGSIYINDPSQTQYLNYIVYDSKEFLTAIPKSQNFKPFADHLKILNDINVCDYIDNKGVKEVWVWMYHTTKVAPIESNMSMGTAFRNFWTQPDFGDVSNSYRQNDLPVCKNTYTVYDYNYTRWVAEALENHTHQFEALFGYLNSDLFWTKFVRPYGKMDKANSCGDTHFPPNGATDYDWKNPRVVTSNCSDWHPDASGRTEQVSCLNWTCQDDGGTTYKIWWMQRIPGFGNALAYQNHQLRNWWEFVGDFDSAVTAGKNLVE